MPSKAHPFLILVETNVVVQAHWSISSIKVRDPNVLGYFIDNNPHSLIECICNSCIVQLYPSAFAMCNVLCGRMTDVLKANIGFGTLDPCATFRGGEEVARDVDCSRMEGNYLRERNVLVLVGC